MSPQFQNAKDWRLVKEYDLYIPLNYNDGTAVAMRKLEESQEALLRQFGGVTYFPPPNRGYWRFGGVTYRDEIVIYRVITRNVRSARRYFARLKTHLKQELGQEDILIVEKDAEVL